MSGGNGWEATVTALLSGWTGSTPGSTVTEDRCVSDGTDVDVVFGIVVADFVLGDDREG